MNKHYEQAIRQLVLARAYDSELIKSSTEEVDMIVGELTESHTIADELQEVIEKQLVFALLNPKEFNGSTNLQ